jgi:hypothetical protein
MAERPLAALWNGNTMASGLLKPQNRPPTKGGQEVLIRFRLVPAGIKHFAFRSEGEFKEPCFFLVFSAKRSNSPLPLLLSPPLAPMNLPYGSGPRRNSD